MLCGVYPWAYWHSLWNNEKPATNIRKEPAKNISNGGLVTQSMLICFNLQTTYAALVIVTTMIQY